MEREEALNTIRKYKENWMDEIQEAIETLVPELRKSEEDEKMRLEAIKRIDELEYLGIPCNNVRKVLESLRSRPKSSGNWKPSEWQMSMLLAVINDPNNAGSESCHLALKSIYEQLKQLKQ